MYRCDNDIEAGVPAVSSGDIQPQKSPSKTGGSRRLSTSKTQSSAKLKKRSSKMATAGAGSEEKKRLPVTEPNNTKKLILSSGILLCVVSVVAIAMVLSGNYGPTYNMSIEQFSGELQMEELEGELVTWSEDYSDLQSSRSRGLTRLLSEKLSAAFEEEGIFVDEVSVSELSPTDPMTFTTSHPVEKSSSESNGTASRSAAINLETLTPEQLNEIEVETIEHKDVRFVSTKFVTMGTPSKNAAVFSASNGRWPEVSQVMQSRMASQGMKIAMRNLWPQVPFMNSVREAVQANPTLMNLPARVPPASPCGCQLNGFRVRSRVKMCQCDGSCVYPGVTIWGGGLDEFAAHSPICASAFYAGITQHQGGVVEVIMIGTGQARPGEPRNGLLPMTPPFRTKMFRLKRAGPVIQSPPSSPIFSNTHPNMNFGADTADELMFTIHVHYQAIEGQPATYDPSMANLQSAQSQQIIGSVSPKIQSVVESLGFSVGSVDVVAILMPPEKIGIIFGFEIKGKDDPNVKNAVQLESSDPAKLPFLISQPLMAEGAMVRSFRYARGFLGKMTEMMENGGGD